MHVIMGGTGHVGSAVVETLLERGQPVTLVTHDAGHAQSWVERGAQIVVADVRDVASLRSALRRGTRAFLLNPPADPTTDTDAVERAQVANILTALEGSKLEKIVAESTAGAQKGDRVGDLSVLWELEEGLRRQPMPSAINRAAYYMSNWDLQLDSVRETGKLKTMLPADLAIPMVAPDDLGRVAADRLLSTTGDTGVRCVEGPKRYSSVDVADAFSRALGRPVDVEVTPRAKWKDAFRAMGFSKPAADSYTRMTEVSVDQGFDIGEDSIRGETTLESYISRLIERR
jgi:uncharacterized protein YbjT (DUF2867 family)